MIQGVVTKTGNSYAIRVPKRYIDENGCRLGDKVDLPEGQLEKQHKALKELIAHGKDYSPRVDIDEIVAWQKEQRASWGGRTND